MRRAPQSAAGARARKTSSLQIGSGREPGLWEGRLHRGPLLYCLTARSWGPTVLASVPGRLTEKLPQPVQSSAALLEAPRAAAARHAQCARSAPSVPRACRGGRRRRLGKRRGCILGWGMGAHTAASSLSHSLGKHAGQGREGGARSGNPTGRPAFTCCGPHAPGPRR